MKTIPLSQGKVALVDDEDYKILSKYKWGADKRRATWYAGRHVGIGPNHALILMHRQILGALSGGDTHHKNGNGLDNRRHNIVMCTRSQHNMTMNFTGGTSRYRGVCWCAEIHKWKAYVSAEGKQHRLGCFLGEQEAAKAYDTAVTALCGEFATLNFPVTGDDDD